MINARIAMFCRVVVVFLAAGSAFGCAHSRSGPTFQAVTEALGPPAQGAARIVVMREKAFTGLVDRAWPVKLDNQSIGDLKAGTFLYLDRPAGRHELSLDLWDYPGVSRHGFDADEGRTYFFVVDLNATGKAVSGAAAFAGLLGWAASSSLAGDGGPVNFAPVDEAAARERISELRLAGS